MPLERLGLTVRRMDADTLTRGLTVREVAQRYRVGRAKVLGWLRSGQLRGLNVAGVRCGKPQYVIPPDALAEFERGRAAAVPAPPPRRRRTPAVTDYYP
jgi:transposase